MLHTTPDEYVAQVMQWKKEGLETSAIRSRLLEQNIPEPMMQEIMNQWKKIRTTQKRNSGFLYCGIGGALLFSSFAITLSLFNTEYNFSFFLYGFTVAGISLVIKGMVDLMGW
jgi:hypothetical protein